MLLIAKAVGVLTAAVFLWMMIVYFRAGPRRGADRMASAAVVLAAVSQGVCFCLATSVSAARCAISIALFGLANLLFWAARAAHGPSVPAGVFGGGVPAAVVEAGPYQWVRHPFYLAYVLAFFGAAVVTGRWWAYLLTAAAWLLYDRAAAQEERLMRASPRVGSWYTAYTRRSGRWLPRIAGRRATLTVR